MRTISLKVDEAILSKWKVLAAVEGRSLSNWIKRQCEGGVRGDRGGELTEEQRQDAVLAQIAHGVFEGQAKDAGGELQPLKRRESFRVSAPRSEPLPKAQGKRGVKQRKTKLQDGRCPHGFMVVDGVTLCGEC